MPDDTTEARLIGHVLFIDIVGYSKLLTNEQRERLQRLNGIVRERSRSVARKARVSWSVCRRATVWC